MSVITRLLEFGLAAHTLKWPRLHMNGLMRRLASILFLVILSAILALMACLIIYALLYILMTSNGLSPMLSLLVLLALTAVGLTVAITITSDRWEKLRTTSESIVGNRSPLAEIGHKILTAFLDGFERARPSPSSR